MTFNCNSSSGICDDQTGAVVVAEWLEGGRFEVARGEFSGGRIELDLVCAGIGGSSSPGHFSLSASKIPPEARRSNGKGVNSGNGAAAVGEKFDLTDRCLSGRRAIEFRIKP